MQTRSHIFASNLLLVAIYTRSCHIQPWRNLFVPVATVSFDRNRLRDILNDLLLVYDASDKDKDSSDILALAQKLLELRQDRQNALELARRHEYHIITIPDSQQQLSKICGHISNWKKNRVNSSGKTNARLGRRFFRVCFQKKQLRVFLKSF